MAEEKDTETPGTGAAESDDAARNDDALTEESVNEVADEADVADGTADPSASDETDGRAAGDELDDPDELDEADELDDAEELDARFAEQVGSDSDGSDDSDGDDSDGDDNDGDDNDELVGVGAPTGRSQRRSGSSDDVATRKSTGRPKKDRPTPKQRTERAENKRTGPIEFVKGSVGELRKVVYPTGPQLGNLFVVVLIFVLMVIAIVTALDAGFGWLMLRIFT